MFKNELDFMQSVTCVENMHESILYEQVIVLCSNSTLYVVGMFMHSLPADTSESLITQLSKQKICMAQRSTAFQGEVVEDIFMYRSLFLTYQEDQLATIHEMLDLFPFQRAPRILYDNEWILSEDHAWHYVSEMVRVFREKNEMGLIRPFLVTAQNWAARSCADDLCEKLRTLKINL